jgi:hypothetical protein
MKKRIEAQFPIWETDLREVIAEMTARAYVEKQIDLATHDEYMKVGSRIDFTAMATWQQEKKFRRQVDTLREKIGEFFTRKKQ